MLQPEERGQSGHREAPRTRACQVRLRLAVTVSADVLRSRPWQHGEVDLGPIFIFDGGDLAVWPDIRSAEGWLEVYDLDTLKFFAANGTILRAKAHGYAVRLEATSETDPEELRSKLRTFLSSPRVGIDPALADDPVRAAEILSASTPRKRWFKR